MRKIIIFGINHFAEELNYMIEEDGIDEVLAYTVDRKYKTIDSLDGKRVISYEDLHVFYSQKDVDIIVAIGYSQMNEVRKKIIQKCRSDGWKIGGYCHPSVWICNSVIGEGNIIFDQVQIRHKTRIGEGNILLAHTVIAHNCDIGSYNYFAGSVHILGNNTIGNNNFFGNSSIRLDSGHTGNNNLFAAGTIVREDVKDGYMVSSAVNRITKVNNRCMDLVLMKNGN